MSLPPGFLDELRGRLSLAQVVGRKVMWDTRKSNQGKGDMWAPCPFHQEKTASFHVDDRKGYYYCFGCHAKGDAISFVRETENVDFIEAVKILAGEAGMPMPERDPQAQAKADRRTQLVEVMEQAVQFYRLQLKTGAGAAARDYLAGRGLTGQALDRWEIGFAPEGWQNLADALGGKGVDPELLQAAGLTKPSDKGRAPYDVFRNRIMFPIRDARGRAIAFGGRAMDPNDNAKYLNSPETELFDKSRSLYNHGPAREAAGKGQPLVVAEGYMDVIALSEAGFGATVAPLGTAVTENQLALLWRIADEPVMALDGDKAGIRAAMRLIDVALPLLEAGKSLRYALLPEGQDPDDLLKSQGREAMQKVIEAARPMVSLLWQEETEGKVFDSPERRAALDKSLRERIKRIKDPSIRRHYGDEVQRLRQELFGTAPKPQSDRFQPGRRWPPKPAATPGAKASALVGSEGVEDRLHEAAILAVLIANPEVVPQFEALLEGLEPSDPGLRMIHGALLRHPGGDDLRTALEQECGPAPLETLFAQPHVAIIPAVRRPGDLDAAATCLAEEFAKLAARRGHAREIAEAVEDLGSDLADEHLTARLAQSADAMDRAGQTQGEDKTEYETGANGARISRGEKAAFNDLLARIGHGSAGQPD